MPATGKEGGGGACGKATKGAAGEEAGVPCKEKSAGRRKEVEESRRERGGVPYRGKCAARGVEKEFVGDVEKESRVVLWTDSATRCRVVGVGMAQPRSRCHIFEMPKMWQRGMLCGR